MGLWATLIGGTAGLALGGPLGALLGAVAGHAIDRLQTSPAKLQPPEQAVRSAAFTIGAIALAAKMAKADGHVTDDEIIAFGEVFTMEPGEAANMRRVFDLARQSTAGYESYARQIAALFEPASPVLEELLGALCHIARADGHVPEQELDYLRHVAELFGFVGAEFERIRWSHLGDLGWGSNPYIILGLTPDMAPETMKAAWRRLVRENHPDRLMAEGLPPQAIKLANEKLAAINAAWDDIKRRHPVD